MWHQRIRIEPSSQILGGPVQSEQNTADQLTKIRHGRTRPQTKLAWSKTCLSAKHFWWRLQRRNQHTGGTMQFWTSDKVWCQERLDLSAVWKADSQDKCTNAVIHAVDQWRFDGGKGRPTDLQQLCPTETKQLEEAKDLNYTLCHDRKTGNSEAQR